MAAATAVTTNFCVPPPNPILKPSNPRKPKNFLCFKCPSNSHSPILTTPSATLKNALTTIDHPDKTNDCNTQISRFCQLGNVENAMNLLYNTPKSHLDLNSYCSILQLCTDCKSLEDGKEVHSLLKSSGVVIDSVLGSRLVQMYVKCVDLREGRRVFDEIVGTKEVFFWNIMINEYAKIRNFSESISLFEQMKLMGVRPNNFTFTCVLKCFAALGCVQEGEEAHGCLLKLGYESYNAIGNALISFYSKSKKIESAHKVFDEMLDRDVVSWNSIINAFVSNGLAVKGAEIFSQMRFGDVKVDLATMVSVLPACAEMGMLLLGKTIHGHVIKSHHGFNGEIRFNNSLLDMYAKCGDLGSTIQIFNKMERRCVVSWTSMISGYAREGHCDVAIELFREMEEEGVRPDLYTITSILHGCACNGLLESGKEVHEYIVNNSLQSNLFVANALMEMYAKCGSMSDAKLVFDQMLVRDVISWNTMIGGYSKNCLPNEALDLFMKMQQEFKPNGITMSCILPACASLSALERGREIHASVLRNGYSDHYISNALIDMYAKCGALVLAKLLFDRMPVKDLVSWTVMIAGYGMHGCGKDSIALFNEMREVGIVPDEVSFIAILYACSHSGLLDEGRKFFHIMRYEYKIEPKLEHYACMVDLFARAGQLTKGYKFIEKMPIEPDSTIWGALLCGCRTHRDVKLAEKVAERVFELEPENTGYYVLLANVYAEADKWEEVKKTRERISRRGLRKNPGCSWIEMKNKVHVFVAGNSSHPYKKEIDLLLERVRMKMKEEGFLPNKRYALINAGEMEKEEVLCGHSEKLAMAYGILGLPPGKTVRVTKNLRVCGDCHEMANFMSKMFMKEIVLRDSSRFHHFKDGRCSCRGYW